MTNKNTITRKRPPNARSLSFEDKVRVAWAYHCEHIPQQTLSALYGVNAGRINEACMAVSKALKEAD